MNPHFRIFASILSLSLLGGILTAQQQTETYSGFFGGRPCEVTVNWANYAGQGAVDGNIVVENGAILRFSGTNPRQGVLDISVQGQRHELQQSRTATAIAWTGDTLSFSRPAANNAMPPGGAAGVEKKYTGFFRGKSCTATLRWQGENCAGTMVVERGATFALDGGVLEGRLLELEISTEPIVHKLEKSAAGTRTSWVGDYLSLTESAAAAPGIPPARPPTMRPPGGSLGGGLTTGGTNLAPSTVWVIACEAEETRKQADAAAARWRSRGFTANTLWIPDYSSLSGARLWLTYVGPFNYADKAGAQQVLKRVQNHYSDAYGIKVDQSGKRETF